MNSGRTFQAADANKGHEPVLGILPSFHWNGIAGSATADRVKDNASGKAIFLIRED